MTEVTVSARVTRDVEEELEKYMREEGLDRSVSIRRLLVVGLRQWRKETALDLLEKGEVTFNKAAKTAGMDVWSFSDEVAKSGIVWIKQDPDKLRKELRQL